MASERSELEDAFNSMLGEKVGCYTLTSVFAFGTYGAVFCGEHEKTEKSVAIKCLFKKGLSLKQAELQRTELTLNQKIGTHKHICSLLEAVETEEHLFLIFEFCENGDLFDLIREGKLTDLARAKELFLQAIAGIEHCHSRGVFHRDLKPENLLLTMGLIKVADFGLASTEPFPQDIGVGSPPYMGPELFDKSLASYSAPKADVWALGVIFFNMLFKVNPWERAVPTDPHFAAHVKDPQGSLRKRFNLSDQLVRIFAAVFEPNFNKRCSLKELRSMVLALDFTPAATKSHGFFSYFFSSPSSAPAPAPAAAASATSTTTPAAASAAAAAVAPPSPFTTPAATPSSALSKAIASSSATTTTTPSPKPGSISTTAAVAAAATATPIPTAKGGTSTSTSSLSSSVASDASFKSALSSSFTQFGMTPTTPVSIRSSAPKSSSAETFSSSFASSWADDDGEMDYDALPDFEDGFGSHSLGSEVYGSCTSSPGSFVEDHATRHPPTSTSFSHLSPKAAPFMPVQGAKGKKHSPKAGPHSMPHARDRSRAKGAVPHEEPDRHSSEDDHDDDDAEEGRSSQNRHRRENSDDNLFVFDEDWQTTLPQVTPGAQATPGGLKGSSPAFGTRKASPANTPKVTSNVSARRKSGAGLSSSTFVPLPGNPQHQQQQQQQHPHNHSHSRQAHPPSNGRTTVGFNTPQPRSSPSSSYSHSHSHSAHSSSLPSKPHGGAHAPPRADLSFIPSINSELALTGIAHIYDRPRSVHPLSSQ